MQLQYILEVCSFCMTTTLLLIISFTIGKVVSSLFITNAAKKLSKFQKLFIRISLGTFILITIFSIVITKGKTVFIGGLILLLILLFKFRSNLNSNNYKSCLFSPVKFSSYDYLLIISGMFFVSWNYFQYIFDFESGGYLSPNIHHLTYSNIAGGIKHYGIESFYNLYFPFNSTEDYTFPYHYLEFHLTALISTITGINSYQTLVAVVQPVFQIITLLGFLSLTEEFKYRIKMPDYILCFLGLFFCGFFVNYQYLTEAWGNLGIYTNSAMNYKIAFYYPFIQLSILFTLKKDYFNTLIVLGCLFLSNIIVFPSIWTGVFLTLILFYFIEERKKKLSIMLAFWIAFPIYFLIFYTITGAHTSTDTFSISAIVEAANFTYYRITIIDNLIKCLLLFWPFGVIVLGVESRRLLLKLSSNPLFIAPVLIFCVGLLLFTITYYDYNGFQFFSISQSLVLNNLFILVIIWFSIKQQRIIRITSLLLFALTISLTLKNYNYINHFKPTIKQFEAEFLSKVRNELENQKSPRVLFVYDSQKVKTLGFTHESPGSYLYLFRDNIGYVPYIGNYSIESIIHDKEWNEEFSPFYEFIKRGVNTTQNDLEAIENFISHNKIRYIATKQGTQTLDKILEMGANIIAKSKNGEIFLKISF